MLRCAVYAAAQRRSHLQLCCKARSGRVMAFSFEYSTRRVLDARPPQEGRRGAI